MKHSWISAICCIIFLQVSQLQGANITFPNNLLIGSATSSYQIEGGWNASDKGENTWDYFTHNYPENIVDRSNGDIACDSYNKYEEDVDWLAYLGVDFYRFSLSWSRILPTGFADQVSQDGIQYYKNLIEALLAKNITPIVTIYHWDHPQMLENMGGWTNEMMVEWFADFARIVFRELGPYVKTFITINEPTVIAAGYNSNRLAPGKILDNMGHYITVHNVLKAHATAWHIYDEEFRSTQLGQVGLTTQCSGWVRGENVTDASIDQYFEFICGWVLNPLYIGDYPEIVKTRMDTISKLEGYPFSRLPSFSEYWISYINGSSDFLGINHYTSVLPTFDPNEELGVYTKDSGIISGHDDSWAIGNNTWIYVVPEGFGNLLRMIRDKYNNPPLYVFENGYSDGGQLDDYNRISYYHQYMTALLTAINDDGCNVLGYTIWSFLDNYEWTSGYTECFGIISVDFDSPDRTRSAKLSTTWWHDVLNARELIPVPTKNSTL